MRFTPQPRAIFRYLIFKKWSCAAVLCAFWLENVSLLNSYLRTRCFSEPTFRPSRITNHWKNTAILDFPNISRVCISFLVNLLSSDFSSHLCFSCFKLSEVRLPNFVQLYKSVAYSPEVVCIIGICRAGRAGLPKIKQTSALLTGGCQSGVSETVETYISRRGISIKTTRKASTYGWFKKSTILVWSDTDWSGNCLFVFVGMLCLRHHPRHIFWFTCFYPQNIWNHICIIHSICSILETRKNPLILTSICFQIFSKRNLQMRNPKGTPDVIPHRVKVTEPSCLGEGES